MQCPLISGKVHFQRFRLTKKFDVRPKTAVSSHHTTNILNQLNKYYNICTQSAVSAIYEIMYILTDVPKYGNLSFDKFSSTFCKIRKTAKLIDQKCLQTFVLDLENRSPTKCRKNDLKHLLRNLDYFEKGKVLTVKYQHRISVPLFILLSILSHVKHNYFDSVVKNLIPKFTSFELVLQNFEHSYQQALHECRKKKSKEIVQNFGSGDNLNGDDAEAIMMTATSSSQKENSSTTFLDNIFQGKPFY